MNRTLIPDFMFARAADITPEFLKNNSIAALLCDIDNTLSPYEDAVPDDEIRAWVQSLRDAGIAYAVDQIVDLVSNGVDGIHLYTMNNPEVARRISQSVSSLVRV